MSASYALPVSHAAIPVCKAISGLKNVCFKFKGSKISCLAMSARAMASHAFQQDPQCDVSQIAVDHTCAGFVLEIETRNCAGSAIRLSSVSATAVAMRADRTCVSAVPER